MKKVNTLYRRKSRFPLLKTPLQAYIASPKSTQYIRQSRTQRFDDTLRKSDTYLMLLEISNFLFRGKTGISLGDG